MQSAGSLPGFTSLMQGSFLPDSIPTPPIGCSVSGVYLCCLVLSIVQFGYLSCCELLEVLTFISLITSIVQVPVTAISPVMNVISCLQHYHWLKELLDCEFGVAFSVGYLLEPTLIASFSSSISLICIVLILLPAGVVSSSLLLLSFVPLSSPIISRSVRMVISALY